MNVILNFQLNVLLPFFSQIRMGNTDSQYSGFIIPGKGKSSSLKKKRRYCPRTLGGGTLRARLDTRPKMVFHHTRTANLTSPAIMTALRGDLVTKYVQRATKTTFYSREMVSLLAADNRLEASRPL